MAVWTISAQAGAGGERLAEELAAAAGVPLFDRDSLALCAHELDPNHIAVGELDEIEERIGGRFQAFAFGMAMTGGAASAAVPELELRRRLPELARAVFTEVARCPSVIATPAAFAALADLPGAVHVRLRAPLDCRIAAYQRQHLVDRARATKAVKRDDQLKCAWVRSLFHVEPDDDSCFTLVVDTSRFTSDRLVDTLLAAGGCSRALAAA